MLKSLVLQEYFANNAILKQRMNYLMNHTNVNRTINPGYRQLIGPGV